MPTGLSNTPAPLPRASANIGPRRAICDTYQVVFAADNQPVNFPAVIVPSGCSVSLRAVNGTAANSKDAFAARYPAALAGRHATITPDTEINYPASNLVEIWASGTKDDGLVATIRGNAIG